MKFSCSLSLLGMMSTHCSRDICKLSLVQRLSSMASWSSSTVAGTSHSAICTKSGLKRYPRLCGLTGVFPLRSRPKFSNTMKKWVAMKFLSDMQQIHSWEPVREDQLESSVNGFGGDDFMRVALILVCVDGNGGGIRVPSCPSLALVGTACCDPDFCRRWVTVDIWHFAKA